MCGGNKANGKSEKKSTSNENHVYMQSKEKMLIREMYFFADSLHRKTQSI